MPSDDTSEKARRIAGRIESIKIGGREFRPTTVDLRTLDHAAAVVGPRVWTPTIEIRMKMARGAFDSLSALGRAVSPSAYEMTESLRKLNRMIGLRMHPKRKRPKRLAKKIAKRGGWDTVHMWTARARRRSKTR